MGSQATEVVSPAFSPEFVASAFVEKYYSILHASPQHAHHFYQDISTLSRPGDDGTMNTVTTMKGISEKIMSLDYKDSLATIEAVCAQGSISDGVLVGVTGFLTEKDNLQKHFSQSFFLARQENGFFVLNDIFHFTKPTTPPAPLTPSHVEEETTLPASSTPESDIVVVELPNGEISSEPETKSSSVEEVKACDQSETIKSSPPEKEDPLKDPVEKVAVPKPPSKKNQKTKYLSSTGEVAKKKSYASILGKENVVTSVANSDEIKAIASATSKQPKKQTLSAVAHPQVELLVPVLSNHQQNANTQKQTESAPLLKNPHLNNSRRFGATSIYVGGLPVDIDIPTLKEAAEEFGDIKQNGVQIVTYRQDGFTFGFVEFLSPESAKNAVEARIMTFGETEAYIVYKRSSMQGGPNRGMQLNNMNRRGDGYGYGYGNRNNNYNY